jgi:pseudouridine-5'-phosphate glycosidase
MDNSNTRAANAASLVAQNNGHALVNPNPTVQVANPVPPQASTPEEMYEAIITRTLVSSFDIFIAYSSSSLSIYREIITTTVYFYFANLRVHHQ